MPPRKRTAAKATEPDETVKNQENPGTSEQDRTPESEKEQPADVVMKDAAPANEVDPTVENQLNPGVNMVDRQPDPVLVEDSAGITYDLSKPYPELVDPESDKREQHKARVRQQSGAMNAADFRDDDDEDVLKLEFVETGLTGAGHVWKKGEILRQPKDDVEEWMELSESEQKDRWKKVFYKKVD